MSTESVSETVVCEQPGKTLMKEFPELFCPECEFILPPGWLPYARKALRKFQETGLHLNIIYMKMKNGALEVTNLEGDDFGCEAIMNQFLRNTKYICPFCGRALENEEESCLCGECNSHNISLS